MKLDKINAQEEGNGTTIASRLDVGQTLEYCDGVDSTYREWSLMFQKDSNLVLYKSGAPY